MNRIAGKWVLVTGASAGIGEACAKRFASEGGHLILWARRLERLERLAAELEREHGVETRVAAIDVRDRERVRREAESLVENGVVPDVIVNNAGLAVGQEPFQDSRPEDWDTMIDTNVTGALNVTRPFLPHMIERDQGHVIMVGSTAGHLTYPGGHVYNATKFALRALTEAINLDLVGTSLRVSAVDPGWVDTEFAGVRFRGDMELADKTYEGYEPLHADDVADAIHYVANVPPHVNVLDLVMLPTDRRNAYVIGTAD